MGSEILILAIDIRSRIWPNIGDSYGTKDTSWKMDVRNTYCRRIERKRNIALCLDLAKALISARARAALLSLETTSKSPSDSKLLLSNIEKMLRKAMQTCIIGYFENFRFDLLLDTSGQNNLQVS